MFEEFQIRRCKRCYTSPVISCRSFVFICNFYNFFLRFYHMIYHFFKQLFNLKIILFLDLFEFDFTWTISVYFFHALV